MTFCKCHYETISFVHHCFFLKFLHLFLNVSSRAVMPVLVRFFLELILVWLFNRSLTLSLYTTPEKLTYCVLPLPNYARHHITACAESAASCICF